MELMEILFLYVFPSLAVVLGMVLVILWALMPPSARVLTRKRFGFLKTKALDLVAYDDRYMQLEAMTVAPEGLLEKNSRKALGKNFYLAKPQDETQNKEQNVLNSVRDIDFLPPYYLDGIPVHFSHISKAIATNPRILAALRLANQTKQGETTEVARKAVLPNTIPVTVEGIDDIGEKTVSTVKSNLMEVLVKLPFDPVDIKKNFAAYWQQSNIDSTKRRKEEEGKIKANAGRESILKLVLVLGIVGVAMAGVVGYFATRQPETVKAVLLWAVGR